MREGGGGGGGGGGSEGAAGDSSSLSSLQLLYRRGSASLPDQYFNVPEEALLSSMLTQPSSDMPLPEALQLGDLAQQVKQPLLLMELDLLDQQKGEAGWWGRRCGLLCGCMYMCVCARWGERGREAGRGRGGGRARERAGMQRAEGRVGASLSCF